MFERRHVGAGPFHHWGKSLARSASRPRFRLNNVKGLIHACPLISVCCLPHDVVAPGGSCLSGYRRSLYSPEPVREQKRYASSSLQSLSTRWCGPFESVGCTTALLSKSHTQAFPPLGLHAKQSAYDTPASFSPLSSWPVPQLRY